jgi:hypothetical protein
MRHRSHGPGNKPLQALRFSRMTPPRPSKHVRVVNYHAVPVSTSEAAGRWSRSWPLRLGAICLRSVHSCIGAETGGLTGVSGERMSTSSNSLIHG